MRLQFNTILYSFTLLLGYKNRHKSPLSILRDSLVLPAAKSFGGWRNACRGSFVRPPGLNLKRKDFKEVMGSRVFFVDYPNFTGGASFVQGTTLDILGKLHALQSKACCKRNANFTEQKYCLSMANVANCVDLTGDLHGLFLCRDAPKNQSAELGVLAEGIMPEGIAVQIPSKAFHNSNQCI